MGGWSGSSWNMVFVGDQGAPPSPSTYTNVASTPTIRERPFLYVDRGRRRKVFVPALRANATGTTWAARPRRHASLPLDQFFIVRSPAPPPPT